MANSWNEGLDAAARCFLPDEILPNRDGQTTAARAAGMRCWAVASSHSRAELAQADAVIAGVADLRPEDLRP